MLEDQLILEISLSIFKMYTDGQKFKIILQFEIKFDMAIFIIDTFDSNYYISVIIYLCR